jgi:hypothetical protein
LEPRGKIEECRTGYNGAFSVVVKTAKDALAELAESEHNEVAAMDLSGTVIELATLQAEANQAP